MSHPKLYATLIGINQYSKASHLNGCIMDILAIDTFLRSLCQRQQIEYRPLYFLAPHEDEKKKIADYENLQNFHLNYKNASFEHIVSEGFPHLNKCDGKDICVLYFSGHGSYITTMESDLLTLNSGSRQIETLVLADSRDGSRDLLDKELAYLLHTALFGKPDVHCLIIMDCCHSGNNTRSLTAKGKKVYREEKPSGRQISTKDLIGYDSGFYNPVNYTVANYVHFAACHSNEKAQDDYEGGVFSQKLNQLLTLGGGLTKNYHQLAQSLITNVSLFNSSQNPVVFSVNNDNLDLSFLGLKKIQSANCFEVRYSYGSQTWKLQAGAVQGIVPSVPGSQSLVAIVPGNKTAEIITVKDFSSELSGQELDSLDKQGNYTATITRLAIPKIFIDVSDKLKNNATLLQLLTTAFNEVTSLYLAFGQLEEKDSKPAQYLADFIEKEGVPYFTLRDTSSNIPLFESDDDARGFWARAEAVGQWRYARSIESNTPTFTASDFIFTVDIIEGQEVTATNANNVTGTIKTVAPNDTLSLSYINDKKPHLRFCIEINPNSSQQQCYIQALYLDSKFGISNSLIDQDSNPLKKGNKLYLITKSKKTNKLHNLQFLSFDPVYLEYNINEISDYIKLFVSTQPIINMTGYMQASLPLERADIAKLTRGREEEGLPGENEPFWATFNFSLQISRTEKTKKLSNGQAIQFAGIAIKAPVNFTAAITTLTNASIRANDTPGIALRGTGTGIENVWGDTPCDNHPFGDALGVSDANSIFALEISEIDNKEFGLVEGEELLINIAQNRSAEKEPDATQSSIVPFSYDPALRLYFPVGYQDEAGQVHITQLTTYITGASSPNAVGSRSIGGSIKLYFKKLLWLPTNYLTVHTWNGQQWETCTKIAFIKEKLEQIPIGQKLLLIVHGILGDTKSMLEGLKLDETLVTNFTAILSYDYENLNADISKTARDLKKALEDVGIGQGNIPKVTIVAHSMGGLVARLIIEQENGGGQLVEKLIMAGTPNGGSEWAGTIGTVVNGVRFLITHALNATGPIKLALTGLGFLIRKFHDPQATLKAMGIDGDTVSLLANSVPPTAIPYYLVGSDTNLLRHYDGDDVFLTRLKNDLLDKLVFPGFDMLVFKQHPNDMAVTIKSMKTAGNLTDASVTVLPGDHISYFTEKATRQRILTIATN